MKNIIFIIGVEGSGTTMFCRILGRLRNTEVVLGNYKTLEGKSSKYLQLIQDIEKENARFWAKDSTLEDYTEGKENFLKSVKRLTQTSDCLKTENIVLKRSAPFYVNNTHKPDILDVLELFDDVNLLILVRDPLASTYSAYRRGFVKDIRTSSVICDEHLTNLSAQLRAFPDDRITVVDYTDFCERPEIYYPKIANRLSVDKIELWEAIEKENIASDRNYQWEDKLSTSEQTYLEAFFTPQRIGKYTFLFDNKTQ